MEILERFGNDAQKERWLRPLASGAALGSFALTEPAAGSDASAIRTRAVRSNSGYVVNGSKQFITNASIGQVTVLFAVTDPAAGKRGMSCFVVENATPGFSVAKVEHKLGQKASDSCALAFDDMAVAEEQRIGAEGDGYRIALSTLESGRIGIAAQSVGMARGALDYAIGYAKERQAFGKPIIEHQAVAFRLVEAKTRLAAARQLTQHAAALKDAEAAGAGGGGDGQAVRLRDRRGGVFGGDPDARRLWLSRGLSGRAHLSRRAGVPDLRGHVGRAEDYFVADAVERNSTTNTHRTPSLPRHCEKRRDEAVHACRTVPPACAGAGCEPGSPRRPSGRLAMMGRAR